MDADNEFKRQEPEIITEATRADEINRPGRPVERRDTIKDSQSTALRLPLNMSKEAAEKDRDQSPVLPQRMSRTETVRQDVRKLKTVTLNRMGKMFKQRSQTPVAEKKSSSYSPRSSAKSGENYDEQPSKKEKSNSLGRMLKLVDKDGSPKKLFHPRAGSLSRMLRRHSNNENNDDKKDMDDTAPGIFSRMLNQLRGKYRNINPPYSIKFGRPQSGSSIKKNPTGSKSSTLPPKAPINSRTSNFSTSTTVSSPASQTQKSLQNLVNLEYSI